MNDYIQDVLKDIGWGAGFHLPVANDENKVLESQLAVLVLKKAKATSKAEQISQKVNALQNHLKFLIQEDRQNQSVLITYAQRLENETHKFKLLETEKVNTTRDMNKLVKNKQAVQERQAIKRADLARGMQKMEKIKAEATWDIEAMEAWEESLKKRDEDNEYLKKFTVEDQRKIADMEAKRKNLQVEVNQKKQILSKMDIDIRNYEQILSRTGRVLKDMDEERTALVIQWKETVKNLKQRDMDIKRVNRDIENTQLAIEQKKEKLQEENEFLNNEINNNKLVEMAILEENALNSKYRIDLLSVMDDYNLAQNEINIKRKVVESVAQNLEKEKNSIKTLKDDIVKKEHLLTTLDEDRAQILSKIDEIRNKYLTSAECANHLEHIIENTDKVKSNLTMEMNYLQSILYKKNQIFEQAKAVGKLKRAEILNLENTLTVTRKTQRIDNERLIKLKQKLSSLEMKIACLEAKLGNLEGTNLEEEDLKMWQEKTKSLEISLAQYTEEKNLLHSQILILEKESTRIIQAISTDTDRLLRLKDRVQNNVLMYEGGLKHLAAAKLLNQQKQVEENVLRLKVDNLDKAMKQENSQIYNLQKYKIDLETLMKIRHLEIQSGREILLAQRKNLEENRGHLRGDISLRKVKIEQLKNKYELVKGSLGKDETGAPLSITHFKVRNAQEKFMLQQEGDEIDKKVRKAETEIVAMENTLKVVIDTNTAFRDSLEVVEDNDSQAIEMDLLEKKVQDELSELKERKKILIVKTKKHKELLNEIRESQEMLQLAKEEGELKKSTYYKLLKDLDDRMEKIKRTEKHINTSKKKIKAKDLLPKYDKELYIKQMQESNKQSFQNILIFMENNPSVIATVQRYFSDYQLEFPRRRTSLGSTVSSDSVRSLSTNSTVQSVGIPVCNIHDLAFDGDMNFTPTISKQKLPKKS